MVINIPISAIKEIVWPAPVTGEQATYLAFQFQLEQSQWWSEDELVSAQLRQLRLLLQHAVKTVPYYKKRYSVIPFDFSGRLTLNEWRRLPILTRNDVQKAGDSLNSKAVPQSHGKLFTQGSSGSTGKPVSIKQTRLCTLYWRSFALRQSLWCQLDMAGKAAVIRYNKDPSTITAQGLKSRGWGAPYDGMFETGPGVFMHSSVDIKVQADWLLREKPDYLLTYPSILHGLAHYFIKNDLELPGLQLVRSFGEVLDEETRQVCRQAWDVSVIDGYSSNEIGYMALQCPEHEHYHVQSENALVEILDDEGNPCRPGETGRVIVTPLHNYATPMLRYAVGDYAEVGETCDCGRGLPVIRRIMGRTRNLLTLPDGSKLWPSMGIQDYGKVAPVLQAQLVQRSMEHMEVRLVTSAKPTPEQEQALTRLIHERLRFPFRITFTYMDEISRGPTDKYEDFLSEV